MSNSQKSKFSGGGMGWWGRQSHAGRRSVCTLHESAGGACGGAGGGAGGGACSDSDERGCGREQSTAR
ncbi:unnamed protein product [Parnassius apollo]|uniref:(apollo) hypothetical protein n=1 Tax=Parnassius apollo TaxID=110799 RepID=A0A8S3YAQ7_PARAO|nr:unnamed protein product [Parnassius apollo]